MGWHVLSIGVDSGSDALSQLKHAEADAEWFAEWFVGSFEKQRTSPLRPSSPKPSPSAEEVTKAIQQLSQSVKTTDHVVIYWAGHSTDNGLVVADEEVVTAEAMAVVVGRIAARAQLLFILDVCDGGKIAAAIFEHMPPDALGSTTFVTLGDARTGAAWDGAFRKGIERALSDAESSRLPVDTTSPFIDLNEILNVVRSSSVHIDCFPEQNAWQFPNPHLNLPPRPYVNHASRTALYPSTWVGLSGRRDEIEVLQDWARDGCKTQPVAIVAAAPGSGKSAILNHLVINDVLNRPVVAAATCSQMSVDDLVRDIGAMFDGQPERSEDLVAILREQEPTPLILLDGLDEAINPVSVGDLIRDITGLSLRGDAVAHIVVSSRESVLGTDAHSTGLKSEDGTLYINLDEDEELASEAIQEHVTRRIEAWEDVLPGTRKYDPVRESTTPETVSEIADSIAGWAGLSFLFAEEILKTMLAFCEDVGGSEGTLDRALAAWKDSAADRPLENMEDAHTRAIGLRVEWALTDKSDASTKSILHTAVETLLQALAWSLGPDGVSTSSISGVYAHLWPLVAALNELDATQAQQKDALFADAWNLIADYRSESLIVMDHLDRTAPSFRLSYQTYTDLHQKRLVDWVDASGRGDGKFGAAGYINSLFLDGILAGIEK